MKEFAWERKALNGEPLPDGLNSAEARLYLSLRSLYRWYKDGQISKDGARGEKEILIREYERDLANLKGCEVAADIILRAETPAQEYAQNPSAETAEKLFCAIYNLPKEWRKEQKEFVAWPRDT